MKHLIFYILPFLFLAASCGDMNENIQEYLDRGEINYIGRVDGYTTSPGKGRVGLIWHVNNDPRIEYCTVYWNNRTDSVVFPVDHSRLKGNVVETVTGPVELPDNFIIRILELPEEGVYTFEMRNSGSKGYPSMITEVRGVSYGAKFQSELLQRNVREINAHEDGSAEIEWDNLSPEYWIYTRVKYTAASGEEKEVTALPGENKTRLPNAKLGGKYSYISYYAPETYALDHFTIASEEMDLPADMILDKSLWQRTILLGDNDTDSARGPWENINNGVTGSDCWETYSGKTPMLFTIDLGVTAQLSRYTLWHFDPYYRSHNPKNWKVYGSATPDFENASEAYWTDTEGGWKNDWTLLADCYSVKPSGNNNNIPTDEDVKYAAKGFSFTFPENTPPVRYIRFHIEETWSKGKMIQVSELSFWAKSIE